MVEKTRKRRKILVTGSSGMLGSALFRELSDKHDITGLDIMAPVTAYSGKARYIQSDIADRGNISHAIIGVKPDLIIHSAAWTNVDGCEQNPEKAKKVNAFGTANVADSAKELDIPLIYISTDFVFDGKKACPYKEEDTPRPLSVYGKYKLEGEESVKALKLYAILRTSWMYGANGANFVDIIIEAARKNKRINVVDDQVGSPTYAKDVAKAISKLLSKYFADTPGEGVKNEVKEIYHVSNSGAVSRFGYAKEIISLANINNIEIKPVKSSEFKRPAIRPSYSALASEKFEKFTGYKLRPWQEALKEYINGKR